MKRICGLLLTLVLLLALVPVTTPPPATVEAATKETILIAGSDFQVSAHNTTRIEQVLATLEMHGITKADGAFFCGDYTLNSVDENQGQSSYGLGTLKRLFTPMVGNNMTFVQGNHDPEDTEGLSKAGNNDPASGKYGAYVIHEDQYLQYNWEYSLGVVEKTAASLKQYLDEKVRVGWNKPIFILSHVGLHWGNRTIKEGSAIHGGLLVDVLNEAAAKGLNIIFLYGHDHSGGFADFMGGSAIYLKKGDAMEVCTGEKKGHETRTIKFTYMNAGYIGYYSTDEETCDATVTMSVFRIKGNEVIITRYDGNVNLAKKQYGIHNLKSAGVWHPDYSQKGYHAEPDLRVYASSRKVTATADVPVDTPMPGEMTKPTTTTTTTATVGSGVAVNKSSATKTTGGSQSAQGSGSATASQPASGSGTAESDGSTSATASVAGGSANPTQTATQPGETVDSLAESEAPDLILGAEEEGLSGPLLALIGAGGVLVLFAIGVGVFLLIRKKKQ